jgi:hypothetical protein
MAVEALQVLDDLLGDGDDGVLLGGDSPFLEGGQEGDGVGFSLFDVGVCDFVEGGLLEVPGEDVAGADFVTQSKCLTAQPGEVFALVGRFELPKSKGRMRRLLPQDEVRIKGVHFMLYGDFFERGSLEERGEPCG